MYLTLLNDDSSQNRHLVNRENFAESMLENHIGYIHSRSKEYTALEIFKAYYSNARAILLDSSNRILLDKLKAMHIGEFSDPQQRETPFDQEAFLMMFFTSGSTGVPVGALKTRRNLESEAESLGRLLENYQIKKVIVTVPFIHIYGLLLGLLYPLMHDIDIVLKEHFLPRDLLGLIDEHSLVVTTPLYIKALVKLDDSKKFRHSIFVSSTAPLARETAEAFIGKYQTRLMQLFGSTETGGIAYKIDLDELWRPLDGVHLDINEQNELLVRSPFVSSVLYKEGLRYTNGIIETFDYVEMSGKRFKLIGRSSKIVKMAGKRYSTVQIENLLEEVEDIRKALVFVAAAPDSLRGELLQITIESDKSYSAREIKQLIRRSFSALNFSVDLKIVSSIPVTQTGKKLMI